MTTVEVRKTWGEREGVTLELLSRFTKPDCPRFGHVMQSWNYREVQQSPALYRKRMGAWPLPRR